MGKLVTGAALAVLLLGALVVGTRALGVLVVVVATVALIDAATLLRRAGARPVLLVALIPGTALPVSVALDPAGGWGRIPLVFVLALLVGFPLLLLFGRRRGIVIGLGAACALALVVGVGGTSLLLLRALPDGFRWVLALAVLVTAADVAGPVLALARRRGHAGDEIEDPGEQALAVPLDAVVPALLAVAALGALLRLVLAPPLTWVTAALLSAVAVIAALGGDYLQRSLALEAGLALDAPGVRGLRPGGFYGLVDGLLLAAPAAYVVARSAVL